MERIETPEEFIENHIAHNYCIGEQGYIVYQDGGRERMIAAITARDAAIRAETAKDAMRWFDDYRKERGQSGNESALHESLRTAICHKEVVG